MFIVYNLIVAPMWFLLSLLFTLISIGVPDKHKELFPQILDFLENIGFRGGFKIVSTYFQRNMKMLTLIFSHDQKKSFHEAFRCCIPGLGSTRHLKSLCWLDWQGACNSHA